MDNLVWNVIYHDRNQHYVGTYNIFRHGGFREDVNKHFKKCKTKEEFAEKLRSSLMYYFWCKCEWEIIVAPWPNRNGNEEKKVDVYWQVMNNWDIFLDYVWNSRKVKRKTAKVQSEVRAYSEIYLNDVVETQGKLFDFVAHNFPFMNTEEFICAYMCSNTRRSIDKSQAYVNTMSVGELWEYFCKTDGYKLQPVIVNDLEGRDNIGSISGFMPQWIGEFYAYYQWFYNLPSEEVIKRIPLEDIKRMYVGLQSLPISEAVEKVGLL